MRLAQVDIVGTPAAGVNVILSSASRIVLSDISVQNSAASGLLIPDAGTLLGDATVDVRGLSVANASGPAVTAINVPSLVLDGVVARNTQQSPTALARVLWLERCAWCAVRGLVVDANASCHAGFYSVAAGALSEVAVRLVPGAAFTVDRESSPNIVVSGGGALAPLSPVAPGSLAPNTTSLAMDLAALVEALVDGGVLLQANATVSGRE